MISNNNSRGIYKEQLMRKSKAPTKEAKKRAEDWLWDDDIIRVFVDASELLYQGIFGIGVIFVGQGLTLVKSSKHYNQTMRQMNIYGEIVAVDYALMQLMKVLKEEFYPPSQVTINSDWNEIGNLNRLVKLARKHPSFKAVSTKIEEKRSLFFKTYPTIELEIVHMSKEVKRYNPFHKAAHNAARKIIGL